jgi:hypothetical protein
MYQAPKPAHHGADESLLEVAPDELKKETAAIHQVPREQGAGNYGHTA